MAQWDPGRVRAGSKLHAIARLIRVEHTLFSLPFAYAGAILSLYPFSLGDAVLIALALLGLRSAAMAYNNIADLDIDRLNPRSANRPLVVGAVSLGEAYAVVAIGSILYYASAALLNRYALILSPLLWVTAMTYPYAKRLHPLPHLHLGLVLGFSVLGGAIAASGDEARSLWEALSTVPWDYVVGVTLWVAGFDIIYSIMDMEFDRRHGLGSIPAVLEPTRAIIVALIFHVASALLMLRGTLVRGFTMAGVGGVIAGSVIMLAGDLLVMRDTRNIPKAFNANLLVGILVSSGIIVDYLSLYAKPFVNALTN
ncbi:MAG: putative 4-hydroxybenzoate polyprenyltransferase [Desulfurococcales archaeon]|nr:putative 4-hydroxybenzoate polyprenyltransferase [Desulfurococcales archaeon]